MEKNPLVSAIVSSYNSEKFFRGKIIDLLEQTIADQLEIIVVNSGSTQNEEEILKEFLPHPNIRYIKTEQRESIYKAWNRGIKIAKGEFITNANTDDRLKKNALEVLVLTLQQNPDVALVYADQFITHSPNKGFEEVVASEKPKVYSFPDYNYFHQLDQCLVCSQPVWRASLHFADNIWFEEKYEILGDYDFDLRITQKYQMLHIPEPLGIFYLSPKDENVSRSDRARVLKEREKISEIYISRYIQNTANKELDVITAKFERDLRLPVPALYAWKRICLFFKPELIKERHFFSIEFIYYFTIAVLEKEDKKYRAARLYKKFLRYGKSRRIQDKLRVLSNT